VETVVGKTFFFLKKIGKGFIQNGWKAVSYVLLQYKHMWKIQIDK